MHIATPNFSPGDKCQVTFKLDMPLLNGEYVISVDVASDSFSHYYDKAERALSFYVAHEGEQRGLVDLAANVRIEKQPNQAHLENVSATR